MKVFIIYNEPHPKSREIVKFSFESFANFPSWEPILYDGCNPGTLKRFQETYKLSDGRTTIVPTNERYESKKSCFYSHFELWLKSVALDEMIAIVEHDTYCVADLPEELNFEGALQLTIESASRLILNKVYKRDYENIMKRGDGIHDMCTHRLVNGHVPMIGGTCYIITPAAAKILTEDCFKNGWLHNDALITTEFFNINYILPSPIVYDKDKELGTSINFSYGQCDEK